MTVVPRSALCSERFLPSISCSRRPSSPQTIHAFACWSFSRVSDYGQQTACWTSTPPTHRRSLVMTRPLRNGRGSVRRKELRSQAARHPASPSARSLLETTAPWRRRVVGRSPQIQPWAMPRARGLLFWQTRQYWSRSMFWEDPPAPGKVEVEERRLGRRRPDEDQPPAIYIVRRRRESGTMALAARFAARTMVVLSDVVAGDCPCSDRAFGKWTEAMRRVSTPTTSAATKTDYRLLMQRCGFGVQDLDRALWTVRTC